MRADHVTRPFSPVDAERLCADSLMSPRAPCCLWLHVSLCRVPIEVAFCLQRPPHYPPHMPPSPTPRHD